MDKNFAITDAVLFDISGEIFDIRAQCQLLNIKFWPGSSSSLEMVWSIDGSNEQFSILFSQVQNFMIKERDEGYPLESGRMLKIAGFTQGHVNFQNCWLHPEQEDDADYLAFVMDDSTTILVKAGTANARRN